MRALAGLTLAAAVVACSSSRPGTTYEVYNYSVTVPDDLALTPMLPDPETIWLTGPQALSRSEPSDALLDIRVKAIDPLGSDGETAMKFAQALVGKLNPEAVTGPTARAFSAGSGVILEERAGEHVLSVVCIVSGHRVAIFSGSGLALADVVGVADTFRFRDPPGDPLHPPSPSGSG